MSISEILSAVSRGDMSAEDAEKLICEVSAPAFDDLGYAVVDHQRKARTGAGEVIYCAGKTPAQIAGIMQNMLSRGALKILGTRADKDAYDAVSAVIPDAAFDPVSRVITIIKKQEETSGMPVLVVCAGTSDIPVAEEAAKTLEFLGCDTRRVYDVGVARLHRLLARINDIRSAGVIIVVAGMEGALASVVGGLTSKPVIAVPTSVGYGASFGGIAALLAMLNSCASGVGVVNIDNGFGAAMLAFKITRCCG